MDKIIKNLMKTNKFFGLCSKERKNKYYSSNFSSMNLFVCNIGQNTRTTKCYKICRKTIN